MYILDDGIRLNAALEMPENASGPMPLALIIHGFTGHMEEPHITAVAESLRQSGIATLRVDMYGHGKSEGTFRSHTLYKWLTNALTVIDYARGLDFVTDLYLIGHSQGGLTAMPAASMKHDQIRALVALSPACMIPQAAREGTLLGQSFDPDHIPDTLPSWNNDILDGNYVRVAQTIHVEEAIDRYDGSVLVVHGDQDTAVPVRFGREAAQRYKHATLKIIPGDTHCYDRHLSMVTDSVTSWLKSL